MTRSAPARLGVRPDVRNMVAEPDTPKRKTRRLKSPTLVEALNAERECA